MEALGGFTSEVIVIDAHLGQVAWNKGVKQGVKQ